MADNSRVHGQVRPIRPANPSGPPPTPCGPHAHGCETKRLPAPTAHPQPRSAHEPEPAFARRSAAVGNPLGARLTRSLSGPVKVLPSGHHASHHARQVRGVGPRALSAMGFPRSPHRSAGNSAGTPAPAHPDEKPWGTAADHRSPPTPRGSSLTSQANGPFHSRGTCTGRREPARTGLSAWLAVQRSSTATTMPDLDRHHSSEPF